MFRCVRWLPAFSLLICLFLADSHPIFGQTRQEILTRLDTALDSAGIYDQNTWQKIAGLESKAKQATEAASKFNGYKQLYEAYKVFRFDSAFYYAQQMLEIATGEKAGDKIVAAQLDKVFVLISAGMYQEAERVMNAIPVNAAPDSLKGEYLLLRGRYYYDISDYTSDAYYGPEYFRLAGQSIDSALRYFDQQSFQYRYYQGLLYLKSGQLREATTLLRQVLDNPASTLHETAIAASTLSGIYSQRAMPDSALQLQVAAAIADTRNSTKETFATLSLSQTLFAEGNFKDAARYVKKAVNDAAFYGARQRKVQLGAILPIIQASELNYLEKQRSYAIWYGIGVSLVLMLFAFLLVIIFRQNGKLKRTQAELQDANRKQQVLNVELQKANDNLLELNRKLEEANKIKEEYVGYFLTTNADFFQKFERLKNNIEEKLRYGKASEAKFFLDGINIHNEKQDLLKSFDRVFLKLFPHFIEQFNNLLAEEHQIVLPEGQLLNTDLRIYALQRLGIKENEKIAEILEYSVKSIYAYKTRMRNRSKYAKENFDQMVMNIPSV